MTDKEQLKVALASVEKTIMILDDTCEIESAQLDAAYSGLLLAGDNLRFVIKTLAPPPEELFEDYPEFVDGDL